MCHVMFWRSDANSGENSLFCHCFSTSNLKFEKSVDRVIDSHSVAPC